MPLPKSHTRSILWKINSRDRVKWLDKQEAVHSLTHVGPEKAVVIASCTRADDAAEGEGTAASFSRADDAAEGEGTAVSFSRADDAAEGEGTAASFSRADDAAEGVAAWLNERRIYSTR